MKENEVNEVNQKSFSDIMKGLPQAAWTANNRYRGYSLEMLVNLMFVPKNENGTEIELTGKDLTDKLENFAYANRLKTLTGVAFEGISPDASGKQIMIDGKSAEDTWGEKYAHVEDKAQKDMLYQFEILNQMFNGTSEITAAQPGSEPVVILPEGSRNQIRREIINEYEKQRNAERANEPEEEIKFEEDAPEVENVQPEEAKDPLTAEAFDTFSQNAYDRLWKTNPSIGVYASPAAMLSVIFNGDKTGKEIADKYNNINKTNRGMKEMIDVAADEFMKEIDSPERKAFLKEAGIDPSKSITVDGQTMEERYGEKYKDIEDVQLKEKLFKLELMYQISEAHMKGKKGVVPEIGATRYEKVDGNFKEAEVKKLAVPKPKIIDVKAEPVQEEPVKEEPVKEEPVKAEPTPEEFRANLIKTEERIFIGESATLSPDVPIPEAAQAKWDVLKQVNGLNKSLKESLAKLDAVKKSSMQGKDTEFYNNMRGALEKCIELSDSENPKANAADLLEQMDIYAKAADKYYAERKGILFGPQSDAGKIRLNEAKIAKDNIPKQIEMLKDAAGITGNLGDAKLSFPELTEKAMAEARNAGSSKLSVGDLGGKFGLEYIENAAKKYLNERGKAVTTQSLADLSLDGDFINMVEKYPASYSDKYDILLTAKDTVREHYKKIEADKSLDAETKTWATKKLNSSHELDKAAENLAENPEFIEMYEKHNSLVGEYWDKKIKAESYLTEKNGTKPTANEIKDLSENKVFLMVYDKYPGDFGNKWNENKQKADELKEQYKKELDDMLFGLEDRRGGIVPFVKDNYDSDNPNPAYEEAMDQLRERKAAIKEEDERLDEEKENIEEIENPEEKKQRSEQLEKDIEAVKKSYKDYKQAKNDVIREHLLPDFLARVSFLKATQDPKIGDDVCRLMATTPKQEKAVVASILDNIKKPENAQVLKAKNLTEMVMDGSIVEKVVPGVQKAQPEKVRKVQQPQKAAEAGGIVR